MEGVEAGEYPVTVGDTVKSDRKGKEIFQVVFGRRPAPPAFCPAFAQLAVVLLGCSTVKSGRRREFSLGG